MALYVSSVGLLVPEGRLSISLSLPGSNPLLIWASTQTFEGHSVASDVLRELFKTIEVKVDCQANMRFFSESLSHFAAPLRISGLDPATYPQPMRFSQLVPNLF